MEYVFIRCASCRFGGWVVDGFPATRENWESMIESNLLPDFVLSIEDEQAPQDFLLARYAKIKGLPFSLIKFSGGQRKEKTHLYKYFF